MKYVNIKLYKKQPIQGSSYGSAFLIYPPRFDEDIKPFVIFHREWHDGEGIQNILFSCLDEVRAVESDTVKFISEDQFDAMFPEPPEKRMVETDPVILRYIEIKIRLGQELTEHEKKALDPESDVPGFAYQKHWVKYFKDRSKKIHDRHKSKGAK